MLLTVPPGGASLTHISVADGKQRAGVGWGGFSLFVGMRLRCKMEMLNDAFEDTLQLVHTRMFFFL